MTLPNKHIKDYRRLARLLDSGATFTAFDTETTGLNCQTYRTIEIGAVQFNKSGVLRSFSTLINPHQSVPFECSQINHITDEMLAGKPEIQDILPDFLNFLGNSIIIGHNVNFDLRFLNAEMERLSMPPVENQVIDTLGLCRWAFPEQEKYNQPLIAQKLGIIIKNAHRAYDDAFVCGNIFLHCIRHTAALQKL